MPGMTGVDVPKRVSVATTFAWLCLPAGLLLLLDGLWELRWWGSSSAHQLLALTAHIKDEFGVDPPTLLRGHDGAYQLAVLGALTLAYGLLAPMIRIGRRWARTAGVVIGLITVIAAIFFIGADLTDPNTLQTYFDNLHQGIASQEIPQVKALIYPSWYPWAEDIAQVLHLLAAAAALSTLCAAVMANGDYFTTKKLDREIVADDAWDAAITRLHQRTVRNEDSQG